MIKQWKHSRKKTPKYKQNLENCNENKVALQNVKNINNSTNKYVVELESGEEVKEN